VQIAASQTDGQTDRQMTVWCQQYDPLKTVCGYFLLEAIDKKTFMSADHSEAMLIDGARWQRCGWPSVRPSPRVNQVYQYHRVSKKPRWQAGYCVFESTGTLVLSPICRPSSASVTVWWKPLTYGEVTIWCLRERVGRVANRWCVTETTIAANNTV